jgi:hypothetical protein
VTLPVHHDVGAVVGKGTTEIRGDDESRAGRVQLGHEYVVQGAFLPRGSPAHPSAVFRGRASSRGTKRLSDGADNLATGNFTFSGFAQPAAGTTATYHYRLITTDNLGLTAHKDVTVKVTPPRAL